MNSTPLERSMATDYRFKTEPWAHQLAALDFLTCRDVGALYTDMGTGKSKVIIDLIVNKGFEVTLIACTHKGCGVWAKQFRIHSDLASDCVLDLSKYSTQRKVRVLEEALNNRLLKPNRESLVLIVNYEGVWRKEFLDFLMRKRVRIDAIVCDESHRIKSPSSKCTRALVRLGKKTQHRYLVTGTPLAENPVDIYAQYKFLDPAIFGENLSNFKNTYLNFDMERSARVGFPILDAKQPYKNLDDLQEKMFSCAFKAKSSIKLPKRLNITTPFQLSNKCLELYKELDDEGILELGKGDKVGTMMVSNVLTMSLRKQQLTSGFVKVTNEDGTKTSIVTVDTSRRETFKELLEGLDKKEPVVVFARYTKDLKNIREVCRELGRGYSEISGREDTEDAWKEGKTEIIGVQYTSGSESVDLTRARYCIYYSLTYSLAQYEQSKKRIHRPGQTRSVIYYHMIAKLKRGKSIDDTVIEALRKKKDVVEYIMEVEQNKEKQEDET